METGILSVEGAQLRSVICLPPGRDTNRRHFARAPVNAGDVLGGRAGIVADTVARGRAWGRTIFAVIAVVPRLPHALVPQL